MRLVGWCLLSNRLQKEKKRTERNKQQKKTSGRGKKRKGTTRKNGTKKRKKIKLWVIHETILSIKY